MTSNFRGEGRGESRTRFAVVLIGAALLSLPVLSAASARADEICQNFGQGKGGMAVKGSCSGKWVPVDPSFFPPGISGTDGTDGEDGVDGQDGLPGKDGQDGRSGVIAFGSVSGAAPNPSAQTQFLAPAATVFVASGERVLVNSHRSFGTNPLLGAGSLDLAICYRRSGDAGLTPVGATLDNQDLDAGQRVPMGLSVVISNLTTGFYDVGLCGNDAGNGRWLSNEDGSTTALVFRAP